MAIATVNPASGETVKTYDEMSEADLERALASAAAAAASYRLPVSTTGPSGCGGRPGSSTPSRSRSRQ